MTTKKLIAVHPDSGLETRNNVCAGCPFRRGEVWLDKSRHELNTERLRIKILQCCHNSPNLICKGNVNTLNGGDETCLSVEEFMQLKPIDTTEMLAAYNRRLKEVTRLLNGDDHEIEK